MELNQVGKLSAKDACQLALWAFNAGAEGPCLKLGKPSGDKNISNFSRHFDVSVGVDLSDSSLYSMEAPPVL